MNIPQKYPAILEQTRARTGIAIGIIYNAIDAAYNDLVTDILVKDEEIKRLHTKIDALTKEIEELKKN